MRRPSKHIHTEDIQSFLLCIAVAAHFVSYRTCLLSFLRNTQSRRRGRSANRYLPIIGFDLVPTIVRCAHVGLLVEGALRVANIVEMRIVDGVGGRGDHLYTTRYDDGGSIKSKCLLASIRCRISPFALDVVSLQKRRSESNNGNILQRDTILVVLTFLLTGKLDSSFPP